MDRLERDFTSIIRGNEYDLRPFVELHPGGKRLIASGVGRDCTALFDSYHVWNDAHHRMLEKYRVGTSMPTISSTSEPFYLDVQRRVRELRTRGGMEHVDREARQYNTYMHVVAGFCVLMTYLVAPLYPWMSLVWGILFASSGLYLTHEQGHRDKSQSILRHWMHSWPSFIVGGPSAWHVQHVIGHHVHTNSPHDPDLVFLRRLARSSHIARLIMAPVMPFLLFYFFGCTMYVMATASLYGNTSHQPRWIHATEMILSTMISRVVLQTIPNCLWFYVGLTSCFMFFSQMSHLSDMDDRHTQIGGWAEKQVRNTVNYATDNRAIGFLSFGLTTQIEHHLFPGLPHQAFTPTFRAIVKETCLEHNIPYRDLSFWQSIMEMGRTLVHMVNGKCA